jgi:hypothetical protein
VQTWSCIPLELVLVSLVQELLVDQRMLLELSGGKKTIH